MKLNLDENSSVQLVCMLYMFNNFYYKTNKLFISNKNFVFSGYFLRYLQNIGSIGLKNYVKRVLERIFTNQLSTKYSGTGFRENHALKNLEMIKRNFLTNN